jgi:hypothetical protein
MPTNRQRRTRAHVGGLTPPERTLLLTGKCWPPRGSWKDAGESWLRPFVLASPAGRKELIALWLRHRDELLEEWRRTKRRGLPWAARQFDAVQKPAAVTGDDDGDHDV